MKVDIKICGLTNIDDAMKALELGADYLGFVLFQKSPRHVALKTLRQIIDSLPSKTKKICVFVNNTRTEVEQIAMDFGLYAVQLHGDEQPDEFADMAVPVWRAVKIKGNKVTPRPTDWHSVARFLVDAAVEGQYGGTGVKADWTEARKFAGKHPVMLAGGITPANVTSAVKLVRPLGIDVSSGVESRPGKKDHDKLKALIMAIKELRDTQR